MPPIVGIDPNTGEEMTRHADDAEPFCALAFKLQADPFVGQLTFFRVYSGTIEAGSYLYNSTTGQKERLGRIVRLQANEREEVKKVFAGEIAAAVGLKTQKRHTRCATKQTLSSSSKLNSQNRLSRSALSQRQKLTKRRWVWR